MKQFNPWGRRIRDWNRGLKNRGAEFRIDIAWVLKHKQCPYCKVAIDPVNAGLDHKMPRSLGGSDRATNLHLTCQLCNRAKGSLTHQEMLCLMAGLMHPAFAPEARDMVLRKLRKAWRVERIKRTT